MRTYYISLILIVATTLLELGCTDLNRDNPLDPANPESERSQVVLVEAFVNGSTPYSPFALAALNEIASQTNEKHVLFLEYHLPSPIYPDTLSIAAAKERYDFYVTQNQAVPDIFMNGLRYRIQGAASKSTALKQYQNALSQTRDSISHFTIETSLQISNNTLSIEVDVARLGNEEITDILLQAVAFEDINAPGNHFVVRTIIPSVTIHQIDAGERNEITLSTIISAGANPQRWQVVVFIQHNTSKEILQSVLAN